MYLREKSTKKINERIKEMKLMVKIKTSEFFYLITVLTSLILKLLHQEVIPYDFFDQMKVDNDASHAFYLGIELARAQIAFQLGKTMIKIMN